MTDYALILLAHGSADASANQAIERLAARLGRATGARQAVAAFLARATPDLAQAVERLAKLGATRILVVPYFAMTGIHLRRDLPRMAAQLAERYPQLRIQLTGGLNDHPALLGILEDRVHETLSQTAGCPQPSSDMEPHERH